MRFLVPRLAVLNLLLTPALVAAQQTQATETTAGTWGGILWIVLVVVLAVGFIALAMLGLRSSTKQ